MKYLMLKMNDSVSADGENEPISPEVVYNITEFGNFKLLSATYSKRSDSLCKQ